MRPVAIVLIERVTIVCAIDARLDKNAEMISKIPLGPARGAQRRSAAAHATGHAVHGRVRVTGAALRDVEPEAEAPPAGNLPEGEVPVAGGSEIPSDRAALPVP